MGIEEIYLNVKAIYNNPIANVTLSDEKLTALLRSGKRQGCPLLPLPSNIVLEVPARASRQEKTIKGKNIKRKEVFRNCLYLQMAWYYI